MKTLTITMDADRTLHADGFLLGVEGETACDRLCLTTGRMRGDTDLSRYSVDLEMKIGDYGFIINGAQWDFDGDRLVCYFPVDRHMTAYSGEAQFQFVLHDSALKYILKSRILTLTVVAPLYSEKAAESSDPGPIARISDAVGTATDLAQQALDRANEAYETLGAIADGMY